MRVADFPKLLVIRVFFASKTRASPLRLQEPISEDRVIGGAALDDADRTTGLFRKRGWFRYRRTIPRCQ